MLVHSRHVIAFSCEPCNCDSAGTVDGAECDVVTGVCNCKMFVMGATCNTCLLGYQQLDVVNPFGCSAGKYVATCIEGIN